MENNLLNCLKEKAVADNVTKMTCKPEYVRILLNELKKLKYNFLIDYFQLVWFFLECPTKTAIYHDAKGLRNIFIQQKLKGGASDGLLE